MFVSARTRVRVAGSVGGAGHGPAAARDRARARKASRRALAEAAIHRARLASRRRHRCAAPAAVGARRTVANPAVIRARIAGLRADLAEADETGIAAGAGRAAGTAFLADAPRRSPRILPRGDGRSILAGAREHRPDRAREEEHDRARCPQLHCGAPVSIHFLTIAMSVALSAARGGGGMGSDATPGRSSPYGPPLILLKR